MSLIEVQKLAIQRNEELGNPELGGQLFLGKYYKESDILFLALNPGLWNFGHPQVEYVLKNFGSMPFWTNLLHQNVLLEGEETDFSFWNNCREFFSFIPEVRKEMQLATFSFLVPWRSEKWRGIRNDEKYLKPSKEIRDILIKDCNPKFIFVSGSGKETRKDIQKFFGHVSEVGEGELDLGIENHLYKLIFLSCGEKYIIQLPHFSRANSPDLLEKLAKFLEVKLKELNFFKI